MKQSLPKISLERLLVLHSDFLTELQNRTSETRGTYERSLREFLRWVQTEGEFRCTEEHVLVYRDYLEKRKKLKNASVMTYITALRQFFTYLIKIGVLQENPAAKIKAGKFQPHHTRKTLTLQQIQKLLQTIERNEERGFRDYVMIKAMIDCGLSEIELVRANMSDLKISRNKMHLAVQGKGKKHKDVIVQFTPPVREAMRAYLVFRTKAEPHDPLFMSAGNRTRGERMTSRGIRERVNHYLEISGIKNGEARKITAFSLRHSAIHSFIQKGASAEELQQQFRIERLATAKRYIEQNGKTKFKN